MASLLLSSIRQGAQYAALPSLVSGCLLTAHHGSTFTDASQYKSCRPITKCEPAPTSSFLKNKQETPQSRNFLKRRMTAVGRFSLLSETRQNPSIPVIVFAMAGKPLRAQDFTDLYQTRKLGELHYRFRSVVKDDRSTTTHFSLVPSEEFAPPIQDSLGYPVVYRNELKTWISDALLEPLDLSKSLWEAKTATGGAIGQSGAIPMSSSTSDEETTTTGTSHSSNFQLFDGNVESLLLFRAHHCMADGVSLGALFVDMMDEREELQELLVEKIGEFKKKRKKKSWLQKLLVMMYYWGWGSVKTFAYQFYLYCVNLKIAAFRSNPWKKLQRAYEAKNVGDKDAAKRTLSWVSVCSVDEVKQVADHFSTKRQKVTINDIFCSCISAAIAKLIEYHQTQHPELSLKLPYLNLVMPVHMFGGVLLPGHSMGNKIGAMISRIPGSSIGTDSGSKSAKERLMQVHDTLQARKMTPAAVWSYLIAKVVGTIGFGGGSSGPIPIDENSCNSDNTFIPWLFEKSHANATVAVTNVRGPETMLHLDGRRIERILGFLPLPPGIPVAMAVQSYANHLTLTIMAEPWAVPDAMGDLFLSWVVEEYDSLRKEAGVVDQTKQ